MLKTHKKLGPLWLRYWEDRNEEVYEYDFENELLLQELRKTNARKILSLGCGTGPFLRRMASLGFQGIGVDIDQSLIEIAQTFTENYQGRIEYVNEDIRSLPNLGMFEAAFAMHLTFSKNEWLNILSKLSPLLMPGAILLAGFIYAEKRPALGYNGIVSELLFSRLGVTLIETDYYKVTEECYECHMILIEENKGSTTCETHKTDIFYFSNKSEIIKLLRTAGYEDILELYEGEVGFQGLKAVLLRAAIV